MKKVARLSIVMDGESSVLHEITKGGKHSEAQKALELLREPIFINP